MAIKSQVVTVGTTATVLSVSPVDSTPGSSCAVENTSATTVFLGGPDVTTANGFPLLAGASVTIDLGSTGVAGFDEILYGVVATGTVALPVLVAGV